MTSDRTNFDPVSVETDTQASASKQSRIISKVLSPAVRFWLRSQLQQAEELQFNIEGGDRQILSGAISQVSVSAQGAVYRGIYLSQVSLVGTQIRTNLGQVMRGKPLRLLEAFPIAGKVLIREADLNASLRAELLAGAVIEFLLTLLASDQDASNDLSAADPQQMNLQNPQAVLSDGEITLQTDLVSASGNTLPVVIRTGLALENGNTLKLVRPQWLTHIKARQGMLLKDLDGLTFDLGTHVALEELTVQPDGIICRGQIMVTPEQDESLDS